MRLLVFLSIPAALASSGIRMMFPSLRESCRHLFPRCGYNSPLAASTCGTHQHPCAITCFTIYLVLEKIFQVIPEAVEALLAKLVPSTAELKLDDAVCIPIVTTFTSKGRVP
jgi:hypothetical protein